MKGTGSWGWVGAWGQIWVHRITSPSRLSPRAFISSSLAATASAHSAPSPSETKPVTSGRAPIPPRRPTIPRVGAVPPAVFPARPATAIRMKSVELSPSRIVRTVISAGPLRSSSRATSPPEATGLSSSSNISITCLISISISYFFLL